MERGSSDAPVTIKEVGDLSHRILCRLDDMADRPYALASALRAAAATVEGALTANAMKAGIVTALAGIINSSGGTRQ
jgi:hypothetical protein